jgi:hypothetical protein
MVPWIKNLRIGVAPNAKEITTMTANWMIGEEAKAGEQGK